MKLRWTEPALDDLHRLYEFLADRNPAAAGRAVHLLISAPDRLLSMPRLGERVDSPEPEEIRRIFVGDYELRYEVTADEVRVLRLWHEREQR